jgi:hypothetical protein
MDLNKHIVTNNNYKPFHSSGFAEAANGNHIGATTHESFERRRQIDRNRQSVQSYGRSAIGNPYGGLREKPIVASRPIETSRIAPRSAPIPLRRYNPFP